MKGYYASEFLYISSICFSKLSLLVVCYTVVAVQRTYRRLVLSFGAFIFTWSISSILVVAFQCQLPRPWQVMTLRCFNTVSIASEPSTRNTGADFCQRLFWIIYCIVDMSTEVLIVTLSFNLVVYLRLRLSRKIAVVACFAPRALVAAAALVRLIWLYPITPHNDPGFRLWLPAILSQAHVCVSICTACIPYMVPFFKGIEICRRRPYSTRTTDLHMDDRTTRTSSSLWFRRQRKVKIFNSWDSTAVDSLQYERVPQVSPYIPTPRPISPLTPPRYNSRPSTAKSRPSSHRGLNISIPDRSSPLPQDTCLGSPQTASSCTLSPSCTSPIPLISVHSFVAPRKAPTPPKRTHSPNPPTASSQYSSNSPSPVTLGRPPQFSLFPQYARPNPYLSPEMRQNGFAPISVPPIRSLRSSISNRVSRHPSNKRPYDSTSGRHYMPALSVEPPPKFSTAPIPTSPPPTTTSPTLAKPRHISVQELNSPMGAAINNYFRSAVPEHEPAALMSATAPRSAPRERNYQILSPSNALITQKRLPQHPSERAQDNILRNELRLPRSSLIMAKAMRSTGMPQVQDTRSSPRLVVRDL
jgi:hypothetical protein